VWIHTSYDAVAARVRADVAEANRVYREAGLGITIGPVTLHDATASGLAPSTCADDVPVDGGRINVHYIERSAMDHAGYACSLTRVIIGHGSLPYGNILAHELGHVFGLAHASDPGNLMHLDAKGAALTPGQVFRANYHTGSAVATVYGFNRVGRRDCDTVTCPPQFISGG